MEKVIIVRKIDSENLEMFINKDGNIETIGTIRHDNNKFIATINDDSVLQNANIVIVNGTRFKKVPKPEKRITEPLLKMDSGKSMLEEPMNYHGLKTNIVNQSEQGTFTQKVKK